MSRFVLSALLVGVICVAVGLLFRFGPRVERGSRWWPLAVIIAIVFGYAPRSWLPWGAAAIVAALAGVSSGAAAGVLDLVAILLLLFGVVLVFWRAAWMEPRSLGGLARPPDRPQT